MYLIVSLVFPHLGFWSGNLFLIAPFPDLCPLVLFYSTCDVNLLFLHGFVKFMTYIFFFIASDVRSVAFISIYLFIFLFVVTSFTFHVGANFN